METTAGSFAFVGARAPHEAPVIERLRRAGAIILGKANLTEWANYRSLRSSNGWSARGGQAYGSFAPQQDPGGSSGKLEGMGIVPNNSFFYRWFWHISMYGSLGSLFGLRN